MRTKLVELFSKKPTMITYVGLPAVAFFVVCMGTLTAHLFNYDDMSAPLSIRGIVIVGALALVSLSWMIFIVSVIYEIDATDERLKRQSKKS